MGARGKGEGVEVREWRKVPQGCSLRRRGGSLEGYMRLRRIGWVALGSGEQLLCCWRKDDQRDGAMVAGEPVYGVTERVTRRDERRGDMMMIRNNQLILEIALTPIGHRSVVSSSSPRVPNLFPATTTGHISPGARRHDSVSPAKRSSPLPLP